MTLTDTHCHLNLEQFDSDREAVLARAVQSGVGRILIPGISLASSQSAVRLAESDPRLFAAVGIHPTETTSVERSTLNGLRKLARHPIVRAIGEIGLDYYWNSAPQKLQQRVLKQQLALAAEYHLPVVIHFREKADAYSGECASDLMKILQDWEAGLRREKSPLVSRLGVLHSFSGTLQMAHAAMQLGFYIGVGGPVTYKNAQPRQELVASIPLERILVETDAPFQAPHPYRGKRNEPAYVCLIADKIGLVHSTTSEHVARITGENARRLFAWN